MKRGDINTIPPGLKKAFTDALSKIPKTMEKLFEMMHYVDKERSDKRMADWWHNFQKGKPMKDLNLMLKCQTDVVPPIPGETGKIEGSKPEIPEGPEDAPKPVIEKGEEEIEKGTKDRKDGKKNFYLGPFLEVFSAFVNRDGVFELLLLHPELARDTSAVVSGNAHFCHFEGGAPGRDREISGWVGPSE